MSDDQEKPKPKLDAATSAVARADLLDVNDVHDKVSSLTEYLSMWASGRPMPREIPDLVEEAEEWLKTIGADRYHI